MNREQTLITSLEAWLEENELANETHLNEVDDAITEVWQEIDAIVRHYHNSADPDLPAVKRIVDRRIVKAEPTQKTPQGANFAQQSDR